MFELISSHSHKHSGTKTTMTLPKDLKPVKRRIRICRIICRIAKYLFILWGVLCGLFIIGHIALLVFLASLHWPADGRMPPRVRPIPALKSARSWFVGDLRRKLENSTIPLQIGDSVEHIMMPYEIEFEEAYDFNPYYVFYGHVQWKNPDFSDSILLKDIEFPVWRSDFFVVNRFNPDEADHYKEWWYDPRLYDIQCMNIGEQYPLPSRGESQGADSRPAPIVYERLESDPPRN